MKEDLEELTTHCIRCGFCLESCPTFKLTGEETESPRGRIYLVRSAMEGKLNWQEDVRPHMDQCLGCRACETACPSGVEYGLIFEMARDRMETEAPRRPKKALLNVITNPGRMRLQVMLGRLIPGGKMPALLSKILSGQPPEAAAPKPIASPFQETFEEWEKTVQTPIKGEVLMLEGCVMRVLFGPVNEATRRLLRRIGFRVNGVDLGCCGALHAHNGDLSEARKRALELAKQAQGDLPIIVNSAGCGSTMKEYEDQRTARRTFDASEFLLENGLKELLQQLPERSQTVTYHDACHLAHGQKIWQAPRELLRAVPGLELIEMHEADTCCGSAGIYNVLQPQMARRLLDRKWANIEATGAKIAVTGNPGCHAWIAQAAREHGQHIEVLHTLELLERAFSTEKLSKK